MKMDYSQFLNMNIEIGLMALIVVLFLMDLILRGNSRKALRPAAIGLTALYAIYALATAASTPAVSAFGGMYYVSPAANIMKSVLIAGTVIVFLQSGKWLSREDTKFKEGEFYVLTLMTLLGMTTMISAGHFLLFFLGLEMASVPMACLVAFDKYRHNSAEAGAKFVLTAVFSSGVMLYGISLLYGATGTLYFNDMSTLLTGTPLQIAALVFFFSGLGFKISLVPFHFWTADSYQGAPTTVTGYLSVISKGAAAFTLMSILMHVFGGMLEQWRMLLYAVIVLSITIANLFAVRQHNMKRFMAFSSISQAGYIMLAVIGNNQLGISSLTYYVLIYIVANLAVFSIISAIEENNDGTVDREDYNGLYKTNPKLSFLMTLALFSLGGIPPFAGFFSKFFVFEAAFSAGPVFYALVFIALVNTVISLYYYLLIVKAMYIMPNDNPLPTFKSDCSTKAALVICTIGVMLFGISSCIYDWIFQTATL
jgi:NADH-quinone oxidoreductase subunit N